jgi:hypothetical protein
MFAAERLARRLRRSAPPDGRLPEPSPLVERVLMGLSRAEARWLRRHDAAFGSSVFLAADKAV